MLNILDIIFLFIIGCILLTLSLHFYICSRLDKQFKKLKDWVISIICPEMKGSTNTTSLDADCESTEETEVVEEID